MICNQNQTTIVLHLAIVATATRVAARIAKTAELQAATPPTNAAILAGTLSKPRPTHCTISGQYHPSCTSGLRPPRVQYPFQSHQFCSRAYDWC